MENEQLNYFKIDKANTETVESERAIVHLISTPDVDRGGDVMMPRGMDSAEFEKTKTVFFNHNYDRPIGRNLWLKRTDDGVKAKTIFAETMFANEIYELHKSGVLNAWSIGFTVPRKNGMFSEPVSGAVEYDDTRGIRKYHKWKLLEYSSVGIPMNPNAIDMAKSIANSVELKSIVNHIESELHMATEIQDIKKSMADILSRLDGLKNDTPDESNDGKTDTDTIAPVNYDDVIVEMKSEIIELKKIIATKFTANSERQQKRIDGNMIRSVVFGELSKLTGKKINQ